MLVPVANAWNEPRWPAMDGEVKDVWYCIQWNRPVKQMKLEFTMVGELSQTEEDKYGILFLIDNIQNL